MTCIVGVLDKAKDCVWLGGDSLGSNGYTKAVYKQPKVFKSKTTNKVAIGVCGSYRCMDLLRYDEKLIPELDVLKNTKIDHEYMVTKFIPNVISSFSAGNVSEKSEDRGAPFLVGADNKLFTIYDNYCVLEAERDYDVVGSGTETALASLHSTQDNPDIVARIVKALEAAENITPGVQRPFRIINTLNDDEIVIE